MNKTPDPLDSLLDAWPGEVPAKSVSVEADVWRRIAADEVEARVGIWARVNALFARPAFGVAFVTACVLFGMFLAEVRRERPEDLGERQAMRSYLRSINPLFRPAEEAATKPKAEVTRQS